jgi:hypothetical protein
MNRKTGNVRIEAESSESSTVACSLFRIGKGLSGAIAGAAVGMVADPLTAVVGAIAFAVLSATDGLKDGVE